MTSSAIGRFCVRSGRADDPLPDHLGDLAEHVSAREREAADLEYRADDICLAWLLERELFERGSESAWGGEIGGVIDSDLFVRFGDVFEGYLPARRRTGDYFELNTLGTALAAPAGRRSLSAWRPYSVRPVRSRAQCDASSIAAQRTSQARSASCTTRFRRSGSGR